MAHRCEDELNRQLPHQEQACDGDRWTCTCGITYEHICDEAEGCSWEPIAGELMGNPGAKKASYSFRPSARRETSLKSRPKFKKRQLVYSRLPGYHGYVRVRFQDGSSPYWWVEDSEGQIWKVLGKYLRPLNRREKGLT